MILVGLAVRKPEVRPVPLTAMARSEFDAELTSLRLPWIVRLSLGAKTTLKETVFPAPSVKGSDRPRTVNPGADFRTEEMVTGVGRVLVTAIVRFFDSPILRLPKRKAHGAHPKGPDAVAADTALGWDTMTNKPVRRRDRSLGTRKNENITP